MDIGMQRPEGAFHNVLIVRFESFCKNCLIALRLNNANFHVIAATNVAEVDCRGFS